MRSYYACMGKEDKIGSEAFQWARANAVNSNKTSIGRAIAFGCATLSHLSVHSLALPRSGSSHDSCRGGTGTDAPGGGSCRGRWAGAVSWVQRTFPNWRGRIEPAGCGLDDGCLNAFLDAALLRVVQEAVPVQVPASASVVSWIQGVACSRDLPHTLHTSVVQNSVACIRQMAFLVACIGAQNDPCVHPFQKCPLRASVL